MKKGLTLASAIVVWAGLCGIASQTAWGQEQGQGQGMRHGHGTGSGVHGHGMHGRGITTMEGKQAEVGKPAPDFTLTDLEGKQHKLSDYKGKVVVLEWTNFQCPYVQRHQKEKKTMQKTYDKYKDQGIVWLAIDSTRPDFMEQQGGHAKEKVKEWVDSKDVNLPYPVLLDQSGKVGRMYGATATPDMFVINKDGVLVYSGAIDDDPAGAKDNPTNYVDAALQSTLNGSAVAVASTRAYGCSIKYETKGK